MFTLGLSAFGICRRIMTAFLLRPIRRATWASGIFPNNDFCSAVQAWA
jgi:hypothetical protein